MWIGIKARRIHIMKSWLVTWLAVPTYSRPFHSWNILEPWFQILCGTYFGGSLCSRSYARWSPFESTEWIMHWLNGWRVLTLGAIMSTRFVSAFIQSVVIVGIFVLLIGSTRLWTMISSFTRVINWRIIVAFQIGGISGHEVGLTISHDLLLINCLLARQWLCVYVVIDNFLSFRSLASLAAIHDSLFGNSGGSLCPFLGTVAIGRIS